jgi:hypothetical protein
MSASTVWNDSTSLSSAADTALRLAAQFWFLAAVTGQWLFVFYVAVVYGRSAIAGDFAAWNQVMPKGHVPGDTMGNIAIGVHLLLAVVIMAGGPLQLVPWIRRRFPVFHRWTGRFYIPAVVVTAIAGLYMVWGRPGGPGHLIQQVGISLDAVLIIVFAALALRYAVARDLKTHSKWALRLFMVVNGVWFFRVGLMFWIAVNGGPAGFNPKTFTGPVLDVWSFADYLLPLAVLELYRRTKESAGTCGRFAMAATLVILTLAMGVGIVVAAMGMWLPRI